MAKTKISEFSTTPGNNTDINGINIAEGCAPSGINNAIRELMSDLKEWQSGAMDVYVIPQGTAAAPGIQLYGDLDTGLYGYAANQLGVAVGGASAGYFSSAGWVGNVNGTITGDINATTIDTTNLEVTNIKAKDGTAAITIADSTGVVSVSTQLAVDNLNLSGNTLSSSDTNGNIILAPNGTGDVYLDADTIRVGDSNANAIITTNGTGDLTLNTNSGTNSGAITIEDGANGNINIVPNGTGGVYIDNTAGTSLFVRNTTSSASGSSFAAFQNKDGAGNYRTVARASGLTTSNGGNGSFVVETAFSNVLYKGLLINSESDVFFYDSNGNQALKWDSSDKYLGINQTSPTAALDVVGDVKVSGTVNAATIDLTNIEVTNIKAKDGSASATIADSTGVMTIASSVLTTTDINGGTIDGTTIGGSTAAAGTFTTATATTGNITTVNATTVDTTNLEVTNIKAKDGTAALSIADSTGVVSVSANPVLSAGTANGVLYLNASKVATSGTALTFDGTAFGVPTIAQSGSGIYGFFNSTGAGNAWASYRYNGSEIGEIGQGSGIISGGSNTDFGIRATNNLVFGISYNEKMRLTSGGQLNLGGNFTSTNNTLQVTGNAAIGYTTAAPTTGLIVAGNVGVGTDSPSYRGHFRATGTASILRTDRAENNSLYLEIGADGNGGIVNGSPAVLFQTAGTERARITSSGSLELKRASNSAQNSVVFNTTVQDALTLDSSGNLGLGVTPSAWSLGKAFQVNSGALWSQANNAYVVANAYYNAGYKYLNTGYASAYEMGSGTHIWYTAPSGTANTTTITNGVSYTIITSGNQTDFGAANNNVGTSFTANASGTLSSGTVSQNISFTQAMTLDASGNLLVNTTDTDANIGGASGSGMQLSARVGYGIRCSINDDTHYWNRYATGIIFQFRQAGTTVGGISLTASATAYNTSSDYRLKDNQQPLTGSGAFIDALKPKTWDWKSGGKGVGFIAHEVAEVSPGTVVGEKDAVDADGKPIMQAMEYGSAEFIANIIAELQSLRARVAQLEGK